MIAIDFRNLEVLFHRGCRDLGGGAQAASSSSWLVWGISMFSKFKISEKSHVHFFHIGFLSCLMTWIEIILVAIFREPFNIGKLK